MRGAHLQVASSRRSEKRSDEIAGWTWLGPAEEVLASMSAGGQTARAGCLVAVQVGLRYEQLSSWLQTAATVSQIYWQMDPVVHPNVHKCDGSGGPAAAETKCSPQDACCGTPRTTKYDNCRWGSKVSDPARLTLSAVDTVRHRNAICIQPKNCGVLAFPSVRRCFHSEVRPVSVFPFLFFKNLPLPLSATVIGVGLETSDFLLWTPWSFGFSISNAKKPSGLRTSPFSEPRKPHEGHPPEEQKGHVANS